MPRCRKAIAGWVVGVFGALPAFAQPAAPDPATQDRLLDAMHRYAAQYVSNLPDFLCVQVTREFEAGKKSNRWHKRETLVAKLSYNQGQEQRVLALVNGKPVEPGRPRRPPPLTTEGEFGLVIGRVLGPQSEAWFTWRGWETLRGKQLAVFDFTVDKQHSTLSLSLSDLAKAIVPYRGSVYADPATGAVWRIMDTPYDIPAKLMTEAISTTIDYDEVRIGEKTYLLPVEAVVSLVLETKKVRNEMAFEGYRKFAADSAITFGSVAPAKDGDAGKPAATPAPKR